MKASSIAIRRPAGLGLVGLALVLSFSLLVLLAAPQAQAAKVGLDGARTTLTTDPATTSALFGAGIIPLPIAPSAIAPTTDAARYTFPVTGGKVDADTLAGTIRHSGGLLLAQRDGMGWKALSLSRFTIHVTGRALPVRRRQRWQAARHRRSRSRQRGDQEVRQGRPRLRQHQERRRHPQRDRHGRRERDLRHRAPGQRQARDCERPRPRGALTGPQEPCDRGGRPQVRGASRRTNAGVSSLVPRKKRHWSGTFADYPEGQREAPC